jgi:hypothetical protein
LGRYYFGTAGNVLGLGTVLFAGKYLYIEQAPAIDGKQGNKDNPQQVYSLFRLDLPEFVVLLRHA